MKNRRIKATLPPLPPPRLYFKFIVYTLVLFSVFYTTYLIYDRIHAIPHPVSQFVSHNYELIDEVITLSSTPKPTSDEDWPSIDVVFPIIGRDGGLLIWFLKSLELFWPHYNNVILLVERKDLFVIRAMIPANQGRYKVVVVNNPYAFAEQQYSKNLGYLTQQWYKLHTDRFSDADYSVIFESDLVINQLVKKSHWFRQGKPVIKILPYSWVLEHECWHVIRKHMCGNLLWKLGTEYAINGRERTFSDTEETYKEAKYNYMFTQPFIYPNKLFPAVRNHLEKTHAKKLIQILDHYTNGINNYPDGKSNKFSEFNIIGHFLYTTEWKNQVHFVDVIENPKESNSIPWTIDHLGRSLNNWLPNPKLDYEYIMSAIQIIHKGYCTTVNPSDRTCK